MNFESELKKGIFTIPQCEKCNKFVWPPSEFCDKCFGNTVLKTGEFEGKIIEFSKQNEEYFCLVEINNSFRIMAKISKLPQIGQTVKISKCGITEGNYFFIVD